MKSLVKEKLKIARESLHISQPRAAREAGYNQAKISLLERKGRDFTANRYMSWFVKNGINLNAMFDESVSLADFKAMCETRNSDLVQDYKDCPNCVTKDREIMLLNSVMESQKITISVLQSNTPK